MGVSSSYRFSGPFVVRLLGLGLVAVGAAVVVLVVLVAALDLPRVVLSAGFVVAATVEGTRCVVLQLRDGRASTIPVSALATSSEAFVTDLRQHLNRGHGYRPLPRARG